MSEVILPSGQLLQSKVRGVRLHAMTLIEDHDRGNLTVGEFVRDLPFVPLRYFMTFNVPSGEIRGSHAHHVCEQFIICVRGRCAVTVDDGNTSEEVTLDHPAKGLYIPPMVWASERNLTADSTLLVFASHKYDAGDYIRDYSEFLKTTEQH